MKSSFTLLVAAFMIIGTEASYKKSTINRRGLQVSTSFEIGNSTISGSLASNDDNYTIQGIGNGTYDYYGNGTELNYSYVMNTQIENNNHTFT